MARAALHERTGLSTKPRKVGAIESRQRTATAGTNEPTWMGRSVSPLAQHRPRPTPASPTVHCTGHRTSARREPAAPLRTGERCGATRVARNGLYRAHRIDFRIDRRMLQRMNPFTSDAMSCWHERTSSRPTLERARNAAENEQRRRDTRCHDGDSQPTSRGQ